jgi:hypothetical protein
MSSITILSFFAVVIGLFSSVPQIMAMLSKRSAAGQSPTGWGMGLVVNLTMAYVNFAGLHASMLGLGNIISALLCFIAVACTLQLPRHIEHRSVLDLPTQEFEVVRELVRQRSGDN